MSSISCICRIFLISLVFVTTCWSASMEPSRVSFASSVESPGLQLPQPFRATQQKAIAGNKNLEKDLVAKIRSLPKDKLARYKMDAAKRLQSNLIRSFQILSTSTKEVPANVRASAKTALTAAKSGQLTSSIVNNLPTILQQGSAQQGQPAEQLQVVLASLIPNAPAGTKNALQGLLDFVSANLAGVNTLLGKLLGGAPDLLAGVIKSLTNSLGAVTEAVNGTLGSLGKLLGGALS